MHRYYCASTNERIIIDSINRADKTRTGVRDLVAVFLQVGEAAKSVLNSSMGLFYGSDDQGVAAIDYDATHGHLHEEWL